MNKEEQIQEQQKKRLIDELLKMPPMVIATAYIYAINYTLYGEDVTEKWLTAVQQASVIEKAYGEGYYDGLQKRAEIEANPISGSIPEGFEEFTRIMFKQGPDVREKLLNDESEDLPRYFMKKDFGFDESEEEK